MSSQIFYERLYIKLPDERYIPLFMNGSNNTWEGSGPTARRERNWTEFRPASAKQRGEFILSRAQILELAEEARGWPYSGMYLRSMGRELSEEQAYRYILNGLRYALTPEELWENGNSLVAVLMDASSPRYGAQTIGYIESTDQLLKLYEDYPGEKVSLQFSTFTNIRRPARKAKNRSRMEQQGFAYVLRHGDSYVLRARKARRCCHVRLSKLTDGVRLFPDEEMANTYRERYGIPEYQICKVSIPGLRLMDEVPDIAA